jgi:hypothetical protein
MALSKLQTDYMQTQGASCGGVSLTPFTAPWGHKKLDEAFNVQVVFALSSPERSALAVDFGLNQQGWTTSTTGAIGLYLSNTFVSSEYSHIVPRTPVDFVELKPAPTSASLLMSALAEGKERASSDALLAIVDGVLDLINVGQFHEIDALINSINPALAAPEISVGILRVTSHYVSSLPSWNALLTKTREELQSRGLPTDTILVGLV